MVLTVGCPLRGGRGEKIQKGASGPPKKKFRKKKTIYMLKDAV
jgi:hypothetical protein